MSSAGVILLGIAAIFCVLAAASYLKSGQFTAQQRTWVLVAAIFIVVVAVVG